MKLIVPDTRHRESCTSQLYIRPEIKDRSVRGSSVWEVYWSHLLLETILYQAVSRPANVLQPYYNQVDTS